MKVILFIALAVFLSVDGVYAFPPNDSIQIGIFTTESQFLTKLDLTRKLIPNPITTTPVDYKGSKVARTLRIAALPFFIAALIANNSRGWSRGFLIAGAGIELTSVYLDLHKKKLKTQ